MNPSDVAAEPADAQASARAADEVVGDGRRPAAVLRRATAYLKRHGVDVPDVNAGLLLASVLHTDRTALFTRTEPLTAEQSVAFGKALCLRCTGTPAQHLTGEQPFRRIVLAVRPGVLIPRPETEVVVDVALACIAGQVTPLVLDIGTGTGAIALSVAVEHPGAEVIGADVSAEAIALAEENAIRVDARGVRFMCGDLFAPVPRELRGRLNLIASNPPYLTEAEYEQVDAEVRADPVGALVGGTNMHRQLAQEAPGWLAAGGALVVEIGHQQGDEVVTIFEAAGFTHIERTVDLAGRDRVVSGVRP